MMMWFWIAHVEVAPIYLFVCAPRLCLVVVLIGCLALVLRSG